MERFVGEKIHAGGYSDASEVVREALRYWREERERRAMKEFQAAWPQSGPRGEPTEEDDARISALVRAHRRERKARR